VGKFKLCFFFFFSLFFSLLGGSDRLSVKCLFRDDWYSIKITKATTFKSLRRQLEDQFEVRLRIKYADSDGDQVTIKREADLQECIREAQHRGSTRIKLFLYERDGGSSAPVAEKPMTSQARSDMFSMFEFILDPVVIISESGIVQYVNKKVETILGYGQSDLIGRNVNVIMTEDTKPYHDNFLRNYLKTGVTRIIGKGRDVIAVKKDGSIIPIHLEVSEKSMGSGKLYFIGILKEAKTQIQEKSMLQQEREVLDTLIVPAIIIDPVGSIHGFNKTAQDFLGYALVDVIGKNVSMFMPAPHREAHDGYLKAYTETGKAKVIGIGRRVVAQNKDGTLIPVFLTVTEKRDKDKKFFTGILQEVQQAIASVHKPASSSTPAEKK
jgi:PAS domain S-box-containing protein